MLNILHTCRHVSRSTLIEFSLPEIGHDQSVDEQEVCDNLELIKDKASGCIGLCIRLGHMLEEEGAKTSVPHMHRVYSRHWLEYNLK